MQSHFKNEQQQQKSQQALQNNDIGATTHFHIKTLFFLYI